MANPTSNFNWQMPTPSDLVTDLPADFETFGQAVDTSLADLKGGTTGQVLSKASNTDMDFTWVAADDTNAIQNAIVDAKGDLIAASAADTPARLAVGANGETLVADSSTSTGLRYTGNFAAGKNRIINGDFRINQRNFTSVTSSGTYTFDRWMLQTNQATQTITPQTFTAGTAPVAGYEGTNFLQIVTTNQTGGAFARVNQPIEDVRSFANQTITVSFWVKANSGTPSIAVNAIQNFGSGGSGDVETRSASQAITTSWARYSFTINVPTIAGKTIGASSYLGIAIEVSSAAFALNNNTFQIWGVQAEAGSTATAFQTATGTLQGELAACRYYYNELGGLLNQYFSNGFTYSTSVGEYVLLYSAMRVAPSISVSAAGDFRQLNGTGADFVTTAVAFAYASPTSAAFNGTIGSASFTVGQGSIIKAGSANAKIKLSSEL